MFYTYVLKSKKDHNLYIGFSTDLEKRISEHNLGKVDSTKNRVPFELIYYEACSDKEKAIKREKSLKTGYGRRHLSERL